MQNKNITYILARGSRVGGQNNVYFRSTNDIQCTNTVYYFDDFSHISISDFWYFSRYISKINLFPWTLVRTFALSRISYFCRSNHSSILMTDRNFPFTFATKGRIVKFRIRPYPWIPKIGNKFRKNLKIEKI